MQITPARSVRYAHTPGEYGPWHDPPDSAPGAFYLPVRRFPPPWSVEKGKTYFVVKDNDGQQIAYVHFDDARSAAKPLTHDEARRIAAKDATGICVQLAAQTMSVPILTVTLSAKLELHWRTKL